MPSIDIGADAIDRAGSGGSVNYTILGLDNPANASGLINQIKVYVVTALTGFRIGTFFLVSGTTYECRASVTIGNVAVGLQTLNAPGDFTAFAVETDDLLGELLTGGKVEQDTTGGGGYRYNTSEHIDPGDQAAYTLLSNYAASVYATGWANIAKINGISVADISKVNGVDITSIEKLNGVTA